MTAKEFLDGVSGLVSPPKTYHLVRTMIQDPKYGANDIAKVVAYDPALTARLLRVANSAHYSPRQKIETIPSAINMLGTSTLENLVLATNVAQAFEKISTKLVDMADFWHHSIYCGILAQQMGKRLMNKMHEQLLLGGLLHDLGKLIIWHKYPERSNKVLSLLAESSEPLHVLEKEEFGCDHAEVGAALLMEWDLPVIFQEVVAFHHAPSQSKKHPKEASLVHVANALSKKVEPGHKLRKEKADDRIDPFASARVPLNEELIEELRLETDVHTINLYRAIFTAD